MVFTVLVSGSRDYANKDRVRSELKQVAETLVPPTEAVLLVHGDCRGLDKLAEEVATELGWQTQAFPADWSRGPKAGPERNQRMIDATRPDACMAFPLAGSRGTRDAIRRMEQYRDAQAPGAVSLKVVE